MKENMFTKTLKIAICLFAFLCFAPHLSAQSLRSVVDCSRTDKSKPPLFITVEGSESKNVLLRLHNNSRCAVLIPTNQLQGSQKIVRQGDGRVRFETVRELQNGARVPVVYNLFNRRGSKDTVIVSDGCVVITRSLFPQQSIVFAVSLDDFKRKADVGVVFNYPWEEDNGSAVGGAFGHYVFFQNEELPRGVIR
jgi:hypothetical protein